MTRLSRDAAALSESHSRWLRWLYIQGGTGVVDVQGRVLAGNELSRQGSQGTFLFLAARDYVTLGGGCVSLAMRGSRVVAEIQDRRAARDMEEA